MENSGLGKRILREWVCFENQGKISCGKVDCTLYALYDFFLNSFFAGEVKTWGTWNNPTLINRLFSLALEILPFSFSQYQPTLERVAEDVNDQSKAGSTLFGLGDRAGLREQTPCRWPRLQAERSCPLLRSPLLAPISVSCWKNIRYLLWFSSSNVLGSQAPLAGDTPHWTQAGITGFLPHGAKINK